MARKVVPLITGEKYHIYNRGVDKREIFSSKNDYVRFYMSLHVFNVLEPTHNFRDAKNRIVDPADRLVQIHAYALLPNHFHMIIEQLSDGGISEFMKRVQCGYTAFYNEHYERSGALFQGKFKRIHIDSDEYLNYLFVYVNENHSVHGIERGDDICYSSSLHQQGKAKSKLLPEVTGRTYNLAENVKLAQMIASRREIAKTEI